MYLVSQTCVIDTRDGWSIVDYLQPGGFFY